MSAERRRGLRRPRVDVLPSGTHLAGGTLPFRALERLPGAARLGVDEFDAGACLAGAAGLFCLGEGAVGAEGLSQGCGVSGVCVVADVGAFVGLVIVLWWGAGEGGVSEWLMVQHNLSEFGKRRLDRVKRPLVLQPQAHYQPRLTSNKT